MEFIELAPGIVSFTDIVENPKQFITDIEGLVEMKVLSWNQAAQSDGSEGAESKVEKSSRNCQAMSLPKFDQMSDIDKVNLMYMYQVHDFLNTNLNPAFNFYCELYNAHHWKINEGWQLLKYGKDNFFVNHYDDSKMLGRTMSMSFYLNDNYEGGEIEFTRFSLKIKPKANQAIFFPANYVYNHTVHPVTSGTRYAVVGWWE